MGYPNVSNLKEAQEVYGTLRDFDLLSKEQREKGDKLFSAAPTVPPTAAPTVPPTAAPTVPPTAAPTAQS